jgi:outer membrane protein assembly factor BamB
MKIKNIIILTILLGILLGLIGCQSNRIEDLVLELTNDLPWNKKLQETWELKFDSSLISTPILYKDYLIVQTAKYVELIDLNSKTKIWSVQIEGSSKNCSLKTNGTIVLIPSANGAIIAVDISNGNKLWSASINLDGEPQKIEAIEIDETYGFIVTYNFGLSAIRLQDGVILWHQRISSRSRLLLYQTQNEITMMGSSKLSTFSKETGNEIWNKDFNHGSILSYEEYNQQLLISLLDENQMLISLSPETGELIWEIQIPISRVDCMKISNSKLLLAGNGIVLFDIINRKIIWENKAIQELTCPIILNDQVFVRKRVRNLYTYSLTSGFLNSRYPLSWKNPYNIKNSVDPILYGNLIIVSKTNKSFAVLQEMK